MKIDEDWMPYNGTSSSMSGHRSSLCPPSLAQHAWQINGCCVHCDEWCAGVQVSVSAQLQHIPQSVEGLFVFCVGDLRICGDTLCSRFYTETNLNHQEFELRDHRMTMPQLCDTSRTRNSLCDHKLNCPVSSTHNLPKQNEATMIFSCVCIWGTSTISTICSTSGATAGPGKCRRWLTW